MSELVLRNRQRSRRVNSPLLRRIVRTLLNELVSAEDHRLCIYIVAVPEMTRLNEQFLRHAGSTDVITFNYSDSPRRQTPDAKIKLHGEIFICMDEALSQARRFRTTWQSEIVRYAVHGILHLLGHDDLKPVARRKMKREEDRLLRGLIKQFSLARLAR